MEKVIMFLEGACTALLWIYMTIALSFLSTGSYMNMLWAQVLVALVCVYTILCLCKVYLFIKEDSKHG